MEDENGIQSIIDEINQSSTKNYNKMEIEEISKELRRMMEFEQKSFQKIEELEKRGIKPELTKYAKMICRNTVERKISDIQEVYLAKIDEKYLNKSKKR